MSSEYPIIARDFLKEGELEKVCTSFGERSEFSKLCTNLNTESVRAHDLKRRIKDFQRIPSFDTATLQHVQVGLAAATKTVGETLLSIPTSIAIESPEAGARCYCFFSHIKADMYNMHIDVDGLDKVVALEEHCLDFMVPAWVKYHLAKKVSKEDIRKGVTLSRELYPGAVELVPDDDETRHLWDTFIFGPPREEPETFHAKPNYVRELLKKHGWDHGKDYFPNKFTE